MERSPIVAAISAPTPRLQIEFYKRLLQLRDLLLLDALLATVGQLDTRIIDKDLAAFVPPASLRKLASWGVRGELVFAVPTVLTANPHLLGYYRLLLGFSQKEFYTSASGISRFKAMEEKGALRKTQATALPGLCRALCSSAHSLVQGVGTLSASSIHDLTLLTLGPQLRGGKLNVLGSKATQKVFDLIKSSLKPAITTATPQKIELRNAAGRIVVVEFAADPDITIKESLPSGDYRNLVAIEIKGGRDTSNIHNRIGEAEKSHQEARKDGFTECWTIVGVAKLDPAVAKKESPSTDRFFHLDAISTTKGTTYSQFRERLLALVGIPS
jgi:hypothetical protein